MKFTNAAVLILASAGAAAAQDKMTIPLSSPSQIATIKVTLISGSISVTAGAAGQVIVNSDSKAGSRRDEAPAGMHRIGGNSAGIDAEEDHNTVTINGSSYMRSSNVAIQAPPNSNLHLSTINGGGIDVTGINGDIEVESINGRVTMTGVSGSVVANAQNGAVTVSLDHVTAGKPMSFTSLNGKIDVTLPADTKARFRLKADNGSIYSDFDVKTEPDTSKPVIEDNRSQGGKYKISMDRGIVGTINGGGPDYRFESMNGSIMIHKK